MLEIKLCVLSNLKADVTENENLVPTEKKESDDGIGIPHIIVENINKSDIDELYKHPKFPPIAEVLDGMGLGPKGPPIPPEAAFAVVPYPIHRKAPPGSEFSHYVFVTVNENDPYVVFLVAHSSHDKIPTFFLNLSVLNGYLLYELNRN